MSTNWQIEKHKISILLWKVSGNINEHSYQPIFGLHWFLQHTSLVSSAQSPQQKQPAQKLQLSQVTCRWPSCVFLLYFVTLFVGIHQRLIQNIITLSYSTLGQHQTKLQPRGLQQNLLKSVCLHLFYQPFALFIKKQFILNFDICII